MGVRRGGQEGALAPPPWLAKIVWNRKNSEHSISLECSETPVFASKTGFFDPRKGTNI